MNLLESKIYFDQKYCPQFSNYFTAVHKLAVNARSRAVACNNKILHSEAISWELTGEQPEILEVLDKVPRRKSSVIANMHEALSYVSDPGIVSAVKTSIQTSLETNHLIYVYNSVSEHEQARIRVLVNLIWYSNSKEG